MTVTKNLYIAKKHILYMYFDLYDAFVLLITKTNFYKTQNTGIDGHITSIQSYSIFEHQSFIIFAGNYLVNSYMSYLLI